MEMIDFFLKVLVLFLPPLLMAGYSRDFGFMLLGFSAGVVVGIKTGIIASWWVTLAVVGLVASVFIKRGGN